LKIYVRVISLLIIHFFTTDGEFQHIIRLWELGAVTPMCEFLVETGEPDIILYLLEGLSNIFSEVGQDLEEFESLLVLSRRVNLFSVLQRFMDLKLHEDPKIAHISSVVLRQLQFSEVRTKHVEVSRMFYFLHSILLFFKF